MNDIERIIEDFKNCAIRQHSFNLDGNYRKGNNEVKKINKLYEEIKKSTDLQHALIELTASDLPEVASAAAVYGMRFNPTRCLSVLKNLASQNILLVSIGAEYAIENWKNNEWDI